jgi:comEA protein
VIWPRSAQITAAVLAGSVLVLVAWRWYGDHRSIRPTDLVHGDPATHAIDLNRAGRVELLQLPGVGPVMADHILAYRSENGPFASVDDLRSVHGIGETTMLRLKPWLHVDGEAGTSEKSDAPI